MEKEQKRFMIWLEQKGLIRRKENNNKWSIDAWNIIPMVVMIVVLIFILKKPNIMDNKSDHVQYTATPRPEVKSELTVEAGSPLPVISDFIEGDLSETKYLSGLEVTEAKILSGLDEFTDMNVVGDYELVLNVYGRNRSAMLHVVDTTPPVVKTQDVRIYDFEGLDAMDFITSIEDATSTEVSFSIEADEKRSGRHKVIIRVKDAGGNITEEKAKLEVWADHEGPVISGVQDISILVGGTVSYLSTVEVTDNYDPDPQITVDNSEVNTQTAGNYNIIYTAEDEAGNITQVTAVLHVNNPKPKQRELTEEMIYAEADKILAKITSPGMSQYETAQAIYNWSRNNIAYVHMKNKSDWLKAAWDGMVNKKGDCYVYAQASRAMLTRAGIKNKIIHKIPAATVHYWNLIDLGEGWRHFDATRRRDGSTHFYQTQDEIISYSNTHNLSHNYDKQLFPDIP